MRWLVDGMNVVGSRPDGWWRDRAGAAARLAADLSRLAERSGDEYTLVLDGVAADSAPGSADRGLRVLYARRAGRDAADDRIVEEVARDPDTRSLVVVTADGDLRRRVRALGASVVGPRSLLSRLASG